VPTILSIRSFFPRGSTDSWVRAAYGERTMDSMSTVPGSEAWRDAGLAPVDPTLPLSLADDADVTDDEDYEPGFARADLEGRADEADVVEQDTEVPDEDDIGG
jgi:hypothetical protein